jgi:hypothetical protein
MDISKQFDGVMDNLPLSKVPIDLNQNLDGHSVMTMVAVMELFEVTELDTGDGGLKPCWNTFVGIKDSDEAMVYFNKKMQVRSGLSYEGMFVNNVKDIQREVNSYIRRVLLPAFNIGFAAALESFKNDKKDNYKRN